jgi:hypothetical protein
MGGALLSISGFAAEQEYQLFLIQQGTMAQSTSTASRIPGGILRRAPESLQSA